MQPSRQHLEFAPPHTPGMLRALALAVLAHLVLVFILAVGVAWKREIPPATVEAELWSNIPVEAAPPAPEPQPEPDPEPAPPPVPRPAPPPDTPSQADIALAKEKARLQKEKEQQKLELERKQQEKQQKEKLEKEKLQKAKEAKEKEAKDKLAREKAEKDKAKTADTAKQKAAQAKAEAQKLEELRQQNLKRMAGLAGSGDANATGSAVQSSGPSAESYKGRVRAAIKKNWTYLETIVGNPTAEVEVRTLSDGTIVGRKIAKSSGVKSWDDAALNAIDKLGTMPRNEEGRVPSPMIVVISPQTVLGL